MADFTEYRENPGVERCQIIEIVAVDILDPESVTG
jgi:hypothetical protein